MMTDMDDTYHSLHINDLPVEMLTQIFRKLTNTMDRDDAREVCPLWRSVIDTTVGVQKWIGSGSQFWEPSKFDEWEPLSVLGTIGISNCAFSNVSCEVFPYDPIKDKVEYLLPHLMKYLEFDGFIRPQLYHALTNPLANVTSLALHLSTLTYVEVDLQKKMLSQTLTSLFLTAEAFPSTLYPTANMETMFKNFCSICDTTFPKLNSFDVSLPIFLDKEVELFSHLTKFLRRHCEKLEHLNFRWEHKWRIGEKSRRPRTQAELDQILLALLHEPDHADMANNRNHKWNFKTVKFIIHDFNAICPASLPMRQVILDQEKLEKIFYMCWNYIPMPIAMLNKNKTTLKEIGLTVDDVSQPLDCTAFSECLVLEKLVLQSDGQIEFDDLAVQAPRLQNVQNLPKSLKYLKFRNIYMDSESVDYVAKSLQLETLILINIGRVADLGITIPTLLWILKESPTITALKIKGINNFCHLTALGFRCLNLMTPPSCPVCKVPHQKKKEFWKAKAAAAGQAETELPDNQIVRGKDKKLLRTLFSTTNHNTKFIPFIEKIVEWEVGTETLYY